MASRMNGRSIMVSVMLALTWTAAIFWFWGNVRSFFAWATLVSLLGTFVVMAGFGVAIALVLVIGIEEVEEVKEDNDNGREGRRWRPIQSQC